MRQHGGDVLKKSWINFLKDYPKLYEAAVDRNDRAFIRLAPDSDSSFISDFFQLVEDQLQFKKSLRNATMTEKASMESSLKNSYESLTQRKEWNKFLKLKQLFYELDDSLLTRWLIDSYIKGTIESVEDIGSRLKPAVDDFRWLQKNGAVDRKKKITDLKGLFGLEDFLDEFSDELREKRKEEDESKEVRLFHDAPTFKIYIPQTESAACYLGQGTRWCTAATRGQNMFDKYNREGTLYVVQPKEPKYEGEKYQLHFESQQFMDPKDKPISLSKLDKRFPGLKEALSPMYQTTLATMMLRKELQKEMPDEQKLKRLLADGAPEHMLIHYLSGPGRNSPAEASVKLAKWAIENPGNAVENIPEFLDAIFDGLELSGIYKAGGETYWGFRSDMESAADTDAEYVQESAHEWLPAPVTEEDIEEEIERWVSEVRDSYDQMSWSELFDNIREINPLNIDEFEAFVNDFMSDVQFFRNPPTEKDKLLLGVLVPNAKQLQKQREFMRRWLSSKRAKLEGGSRRRSKNTRRRRKTKSSRRRTSKRRSRSNRRRTNRRRTPKQRSRSSRRRTSRTHRRRTLKRRSRSRSYRR